MIGSRTLSHTSHTRHSCIQWELSLSLYPCVCVRVLAPLKWGKVSAANVPTRVLFYFQIQNVVFPPPFKGSESE